MNESDLKEGGWYGATIHYLLPTDLPFVLRPLLRILPGMIYNKIYNPVILL
jgi:hypothetical protein